MPGLFFCAARTALRVCFGGGLFFGGGLIEGCFGTAVCVGGGGLRWRRR